MKLGQKVLYSEIEYVVVRADKGSCDIIAEEYVQLYLGYGINVKNGILTSFDTPDGYTTIIDFKGVSVGFLELSTRSVKTTNKELVNINVDMETDILA